VFARILPPLDLTTTGRRSGLPRTTHLIAIPYEDTLALVPERPAA